MPDAAPPTDPPATGPPVAERAAQHVRGLTAAVDEALTNLDLPAEPVELYEPVRYALAGRGKRLRPALLLLAAEACADGPDAAHANAMPAALAAEVFHTFSLVHDDIMDRAPERRGRPSVHVVWDEPTAILAGDLLMGLAYDLLGRTPARRLPEALRVFGRMVARVCEGQALDGAFEARDDVTAEDYLGMIRGKTAALLACALELGALTAGADARTRVRLHEAGLALGLAFQIQDDLLDLTARDAGWGKAVGGDLVQGKKTFLLLRALERSEGAGHAWFRRAVTDGGLPAADVDEARRRMDALGVLGEARAAVRRHSEAGAEALRGLPPSEARATLLWLADRLAARVR